MAGADDFVRELGEVGAQFGLGFECKHLFGELRHGFAAHQHRTAVQIDRFIELGREVLVGIALGQGDQRIPDLFGRKPLDFAAVEIIAAIHRRGIRVGAELESAG